MATVITVSTRVHPDELARQARARVEQDGRAVLAAATSNRQAIHLRRVMRRLAAGGDLECLGAETSGSTTYLMVRRRGSEGPITWRGEPKTG
jgi:hypothetical protein